jgi:hypothetical protein
VLFASFAVLTCAVQNGNNSMSDDVKREVKEIAQREIEHLLSEDAASRSRFPSLLGSSLPPYLPRHAEVAAIKQVLCRLCFFFE